MRSFLLPALMLAFVFAAAVRAEVVTQELVTRDGDVSLVGFVAFDTRFEGKRPAVLVCHEWWGQNEFARRRVRQLAELGYVAMALDLYGDRKVVTTVPEAQALAGSVYAADPQTGRREIMRRRARLALDSLAAHERVDAERLAAIGYCMGGTTALELARSGASLRAVVAFHAGLSTPKPEDAKNITGVVMVCNGFDDAMVSAEERAAFHREMTEAKVDYLFIEYGGAVHSFTNPDADSFKIPSVGYDARADRRSWEHMKSLLREAFGDEGDHARPNDRRGAPHGS